MKRNSNAIVFEWTKNCMKFYCIIFFLQNFKVLGTFYVWKLFFMQNIYVNKLVNICIIMCKTLLKITFSRNIIGINSLYNSYNLYGDSAKKYSWRK